MIPSLLRRSPRRLRRASVRATTFVALLWTAACGGQDPPILPTLPAVGLAGQRVLVFPVQRDLVEGSSDRELAYALDSRRGASRWVLPDELRASLARSPGMDVPTEDMPVDIFFQAEVERIGDPLYGMIRRAASLFDARAAIIPLSVSYRPPEMAPEGSGGEATTEGQVAPAPNTGAVEVFGVLIDVLTGSVMWRGIREAEASGPDDPAGLSRAMDAFATGFLPGG